MVVPVDPHEALIEEIRKEEFGINVQLSEDGQKLMTKQKERAWPKFRSTFKGSALSIQL